MARIAVIDNGVVENIIEADPSFTIAGKTLVPASNAEIGWTWNGSQFSPPPEPEIIHEPNWPQFYNGLLINAAFVRARAGAAEVLAINAAYTDAVGALGLAVQGVVNVPAIQACFDNLMAVMQGDFALDQSQKDGLQALVDACFLDRLITLNWNAPVVN